MRWTSLSAPREISERFFFEPYLTVWISLGCTMAKLDVALHSLLAKKSLYKKHPGEATYFVDPGMPIHVSVQFVWARSGDNFSFRHKNFIKPDLLLPVLDTLSNVHWYKAMSHWTPKTLRYQFDTMVKTGTGHMSQI